MIDRIDDQRIAFYLRHQEMIETWTAVRREVAEFAHRFYLSVSDNLSELAAASGPDVAVWVRDGSSSNVGLYKDAWRHNGIPLIAFALEWNARSTFVDGPRIAGLRVGTDTEQGRSLRPFVGDQVRAIRAERGFGRRSNMWPAYRDMPRPAESSYWEELTPFRTILVSEVTAGWAAFADSADRAIGLWRESREVASPDPIERLGTT